MADETDYRAQYNEAINRAVAGEVGVYPDFDRHRQETVWRILSADRQALLRFCQRLGSDKPLLQLIAHGHDADTIAKWARGRH